MNYLNELIYYTSLLVFIFLCLQSAYLFVFALAGSMMSLKDCKHNRHLGRFVIYLSAYGDEDVVAAVHAALALSYPPERKHIVVIAYSLQPATALALRQFPVQIADLSGNRFSKAEALQTALRQTTGEFDYALMLDARHSCTKGFLYRMNDVLQSGCPVAQGQRVVRSTNTAFSLLDAISKGVDTHIFCKSHRLLGLSSAIAGSGVAIHFSLFAGMISCLAGDNDFDKEMELHLLRKRIHFGYAPKAFLYEEKRGRQCGSEHRYSQWMFTQSRAMKSYLSDGVLQLCKGNVDFLDKVFQNLLLPRVLMLGITPLAVLLSLLTNGMAVPADYWIYLWMVTYTAILMSIPTRYVTNQFLKAVFLLPSLFLRITKLVFTVKHSDTGLLRSSYGDVTTQHG